MAAVVNAKAWTIVQPFQGESKLSDFKLAEHILADVQPGEFICEAILWSTDPYNKALGTGMPIGSIVLGRQVAKVLESKSTRFPVGSYVQGEFGWRTHSVVKEDDKMAMPILVKEEEMAGLPLSAAVGLFGMPGMTAYFGITEILKPKQGDTLLVNAAAGGVGSLVGPMAKILGCKVIGCAGSEDKLQYLRELGFDNVFNYKTDDLNKALSEAAPQGIDCFFDNVGGRFAISVYDHMNNFGRICQCGSLSSYGAVEARMIPDPLWTFVRKQLHLQGFMVMRYAEKFAEARHTIATWIKEGKLKPQRETQYHGFDKMPQALIDQLAGRNLGKVVVFPV